MYMGQTPAPTPAVPNIPATPLATALIEFYQDVNSAYDLASKSIVASKDGKTDDGKALLTQARDWTDKAWAQLKLLKDQNLLSPDEIADLQVGVMKPLGNCQGEYKAPEWWEFWLKTGSSEPCDVLAIAAGAVERGKDWVVRYWDKAVGFGADMTVRFTNFTGEKFKQGLAGYAGLVRYNITTRDGIDEMKAAAAGGAIPDSITRLELALQKSEFLQKSIEELFKSSGISQATLNKESGLGAEPATTGAAVGIAATIAAAIGGGMAVRVILQIIGFILHTIATGIVFHFSSAGTLPAWTSLQSESEQMEKQIRLQQDVYAKLEKEKADAAMDQAKKENSISSAKRKEQVEQLEQMNKSIGAYSKEEMDRLKKSLNVTTTGKSADLSEYMPYILVGGAGLLIAFIVSRGRK
jgi:hypothetical protein